MLKIQSSRMSRVVWIGLGFGGMLVVGSAAWLMLWGQGAVHYSAVARIELPVPAPAAPAGVEGGVKPEAAARGRLGPIPAAPDPDLIEDGPLGPVPRIGADGRRPFLTYAGPFDFQDERPRVAVLLLGLGLQADLVDDALALPGAISLEFSPYTPDLPALFERARQAGHEVLLDLPMEPEDYPASDPGPHTLRADGPLEENLKRLGWLLARAPGYVGFAGSGGRFAESEQAAPVLEVLAERGLAMIEVGGDELATAAAAAGLPYAGKALPIDEEPSVLSIDYALAGLEAEALSRGSALAVALGYPVALERLRLWAGTLEDKGLVLAPVSALLIARSGLAPEMQGDARPTRSEG